MADPFSFLGKSGGVSSGVYQSVDVQQLARQKAIEAYRQGIAAPDVHIADRFDETQPLVLGEDGKPLTPERVRQLMKEAGVKPMFDQDGKPTGEVYTDKFDTIESERIGESAERGRHPVRVVKPKALVDAPLLPPETVDSDAQNMQPDLTIPYRNQNCVFTTGSDVLTPATALEWCRKCIASLATSHPKHRGPRYIQASEAAIELLASWLPEKMAERSALGGCTSLMDLSVQINNALAERVVFVMDPEDPYMANNYSSAFINRQLFYGET